jgi:hypothetical protein
MGASGEWAAVMDEGGSRPAPVLYEIERPAARATELGGEAAMARRRARKGSAQRTEIRRQAAPTGAWRYWALLAIVGFLAVVLVVTSLPAQ